MGRPSKVRSTHEKMGNQNEQKYYIPLLYRLCNFWVVVFFIYATLSDGQVVNSL